jgi:hypothetical protein
MTVTSDLLQQATPWMTPDLQTYLEFVGSMFAEVEMYSADTPDELGWICLLDPDLCPAAALPYLAQYVGERLPDGLSVAAQRDWIKDAPNQTRGTVQSIVRAASRTLTGTKFVLVIERSGGIDKLAVSTYTDQTPNAAQVLADLQDVVPLDISLTYTTISGQVWTQVKAKGTWNTIKASYPDWAGVYADRSGGVYPG